MSPIQMSKVESAMRVVLAFNDALNRHDVAGMMALMTEDCVFENTSPAPDGTVYAGKAAVTAFWEEFFRAAPHAHIETEEIFGAGDRCVARWKYSWGNGSGDAGYVRGVDVFRVTGGLIREKLSYVKG